MAESIKRFDLHRLPAPMLHGGKWCSTKVLVPAGRILYQGSYWTDEEVKLSGTVCTAKLFKYKICEEKELLFHYERISSLHHPNVVEFFGMYSIPTHELPVLVTKHMEGSLHDLLVKVKDHVLPLSVKQNILLDVSQGLYFLHDHEPSVVHAQLTARNILLDSAAEKAKILMTYIPFSEREKVYNDPGVGMYFIHDEVKDLCRHYTSVYHAMPATDIFSFGHLALLTLIQDVCIQLKPKNGETEIDRRRSSFSMLSIKLGKNNLLIDLVEECLQDSPDERPNADNLVSRISEESSRAKEPSEHMLSKIINEHFKPDKLNKIQQPGDDKDVLLAENEALKNELEECKVKLDKVNESLPTGENGVASQSGSAMTNKMDKSSPSAKSGGASESGSDTTNKMDESLPTGENGVASQSGSATTNKSKKERARKFLTKRADYLLDKYSDITALDIDCQDGDVCILVWIKSGSAVKDQLLQEDFDGLAVDVRVGEMRCTMDKSSPSAKSGGASESGSDTTNKALQLTITSLYTKTNADVKIHS